MAIDALLIGIFVKHFIASAREEFLAYHRQTHLAQSAVVVDTADGLISEHGEREAKRRRIDDGRPDAPINMPHVSDWNEGPAAEMTGCVDTIDVRKNSATGQRSSNVGFFISL